LSKKLAKLELYINDFGLSDEKNISRTFARCQTEFAKLAEQVGPANRLLHCLNIMRGHQNNGSQMKYMLSRLLKRIFEKQLFNWYQQHKTDVQVVVQHISESLSKEQMMPIYELVGKIHYQLQGDTQQKVQSTHQIQTLMDAFDVTNDEDRMQDGFVSMQCDLEHTMEISNAVNSHMRNIVNSFGEAIENQTKDFESVVNSFRH